MSFGFAGRKSFALHSKLKETPVRIGLLGMFAGANLGDTAIQEVVMAALRERRPDIDFVGLSHDADDIVRTHGIAGFPASGEGVLVMPHCDPMVGGQAKVAAHRSANQSRFAQRVVALRNICRQMRALDMLIVSGGGQIDDFWGGPWRHPFRLFAWCTCARLQKKPIASFAVGVDDLGGRTSAWFVRHALQMAEHRTFRDAGSLAVLRHKGLSAAASVCPDPAFAFRVGLSRVTTETHERPKFAVISPISKFAFQGASDTDYDAYLNALATVAETWVQQGLEVRFVCSQVKMDPPVALQVIARMKTDDMASLIDVKTADDFVAAVNDAECVIASRLHATILSLVAGIPVIAISPARKVKQQMIDVGLADYCLDLKSLQVSALLSRVQTALVRRDDLRKLVALRVGEMRAQLEAAFDQVAEVIPSADRV